MTRAGALAKALKRDDWTACIIRCEGPRTRLWLSGMLSLDYTGPDPAIPLNGSIGFEIHEGDPSEAWYRDSELEELETATNGDQ